MTVEDHATKDHTTKAAAGQVFQVSTIGASRREELAVGERVVPTSGRGIADVLRSMIGAIEQEIDRRVDGSRLQRVRPIQWSIAVSAVVDTISIDAKLPDGMNMPAGVTAVTVGP